MKLTPIRAGVNTVKDRVQLKDEFSTLNNFRQLHPGIVQRKGQIEHTSTADASLETITVHQFSKGKRTERRLFAQKIDGSVQEATNNPPATGTTFGSDVLGAIASPKPAAWAEHDDRVFFADSVRMHQFFSGDEQRLDNFIVYRGAAAIPRIPVNGEDYTIEVGDNDATTVAILDSLSTLAAFDCIFIMTKEPMSKLNFVVSAANGSAAVMQAKYWNGAFAAVSGFSDGTASGGATLAQDGEMSWTLPTDELPTYMFGQSGFWCQLSLSSGALDSEVEISSCTFDGAWQDIRNVWDGALVDAIEAQIYHSSTLGYTSYSATAAILSRMRTTDYLYFSTVAPISGFYVDVGSNPNIRKVVFTGSSNIDLEDGGSGEHSILLRDANAIELGFEKGMNVAITGSASNDKTVQLTQVSSNRLYVKTGTFSTPEADKSITLTADDNEDAVIDLIEAWTGEDFTTVGATLEDGTDGLSSNGFVTWNPTAVTPELTQFNESQYRAYWYRLSLDKETSNSVVISILTLPYYDLDIFGKLGVTVGTWKSRVGYVFDAFPQFIYMTGIDRPFGLNGVDFGILEAGDGRANRVVASRNFYSDFMVFQEEKGEKGGTVTIFNGYSPTTFGRLQLSTIVGTMNSKSVEVVNGVSTSTATEEKISKIVPFLSREGVLITDGTAIYAISDDIQNYFDPTKLECIRFGYEDKMWLRHDKAENVLRIGLVSGDSATTPNIFPVFDLVDGTWGFDTLAQALSCMANIEAGSGDIPVLQVGGGSTTGKIYQLNKTKDDVDTAIDADAVLELDRDGEKDLLTDMGVRAKVEAGATLTVTDGINGETPNKNLRSIALDEPLTGETFVRDVGAITNLQGSHFSIRMRCNEEDKELKLYDLGFKYREVANNT